TDVERAFPRLIEASEGASNSFNEVIADETGTQWSVVKPLLKLRRTELLFCKRFTEGEPEFAVIQKLNPDSMFAKAKGVCQLQMTGNDARLLLEDFVDGERQTLQLYAQDMVAAAREVIEQKCPDQNLSRVVKAIAQRFAKKISTEEQVAPVQAVRRRTEGVRV
ncbi:MAG: hypothetical protein ABSE59_08290, partial [Opitutaceae bacterium]